MKAMLGSGNFNKNNFGKWYNEVDEIIDHRIGLSAADLEDQPYADMFEAGYTPSQAADDVLESCGYPDWV